MHSCSTASTEHPRQQRHKLRAFAWAACNKAAAASTRGSSWKRQPNSSPLDSEETRHPKSKAKVTGFTHCHYQVRERLKLLPCTPARLLDCYLWPPMEPLRLLRLFMNSWQEFPSGSCNIWHTCLLYQLLVSAHVLKQKENHLTQRREHWQTGK